MILKFPRKLKFRKNHLYFINHKYKYTLKQPFIYGSSGCASLTFKKVSYAQLECGRIAIRRRLRYRATKSLYRYFGIGNFWVKLFPFYSFTKKSVGMRMGKGKGSIFS